MALLSVFPTFLVSNPCLIVRGIIILLITRKSERGCFFFLDPCSVNHHVVKLTEHLMQPKDQPQENDNIGSVKTKSYLQ